jgi:hypothetical protein
MKRGSLGILVIYCILSLAKNHALLLPTKGFAYSLACFGEENVQEAKDVITKISNANIISSFQVFYEEELYWRHKQYQRCRARLEVRKQNRFLAASPLPDFSRGVNKLEQPLYMVTNDSEKLIYTDKRYNETSTLVKEETSQAKPIKCANRIDPEEDCAVFPRFTYADICEPKFIKDGTKYCSFGKLEGVTRTLLFNDVILEPIHGLIKKGNYLYVHQNYSPMLDPFFIESDAQNEAFAVVNITRGFAIPQVSLYSIFFIELKPLP